MEGVKKVSTTHTTAYGMRFSNFPAYLWDGADEPVYLDRDLEFAESLEENIPEPYRQAFRVDCDMIGEFQKEIPDEPATEREIQLLKKLEVAFPELAEENTKNE